MQEEKRKQYPSDLTDAQGEFIKPLPAPAEIGRPPKDKHEKRYCRQRWKVERGFAWINNCRCLDRFLEESQKTYRAFMRVFFIKHYLDRLFY
jgi:transposase